MTKPVFLSKITLATCIPALLTSCAGVKPYIAANVPGVAPEVFMLCPAPRSEARITLGNNVTINTLGHLDPEPTISILFGLSSKKTREANSKQPAQRLLETTRFSSNDVVISPLNASAITVGFDKNSDAPHGFYKIELTGERALWPEFNLTLPTITTPEGTYPGPTFHYKYDKALYRFGCQD